MRNIHYLTADKWEIKQKKKSEYEADVRKFLKITKSFLKARKYNKRDFQCNYISQVPSSSC